MNKKSLLLSLCLLFMAAGASARSLVLELADGTLVYYLLSAEASPVMKVADGQVQVNSDDFTFAEVKRFYISEEDAPTAIDGLKTAVPTEMKDGVLYLSTREPVALYTPDGKLVRQGRAADDVRSLIDLQSLSAGVYVVRYGQKSFKFIKR